VHCVTKPEKSNNFDKFSITKLEKCMLFFFELFVCTEKYRYFFTTQVKLREGKDGGKKGVGRTSAKFAHIPSELGLTFGTLRGPDCLLI
jgi:hypothetical protein